EEFEQRTNRVAPFYRKLVEKNHEQIRELIVRYTERLLTSNFDDQWVSDTKGRAEAEAKLGFDMRTRGVMSQFILEKLHDALPSEPRFASHKNLHIADIAARVLMMD